MIFGGPRHLDLVRAGDRGRAWPVPFSVDPLLAHRGAAVVALVSGDPFWFGAGATLADRLPLTEMTVHPAPSSFSLAAARMGWRLERAQCAGLHAAPFDRLTPHLAPGAQIIALVRDGSAPAALAEWLTRSGWGDSTLTVLERLGGPLERLRSTTAAAFDIEGIAAPVAVAILAKGGNALPATPGLPDDLFTTDGQMTKRHVRALTLSALAPRPGEHLWDIGAGTGTVSVEWALAAPRATVSAIEPQANRIANIRANAAKFGVDDRILVTEGTAPQALSDLPPPSAVFVGGGADEPLLSHLWDTIPAGTRLVVNAVTLETEALLLGWHAAKGGELTRMELSTTAPLGSMRGWTPARPIVQWTVTR